MNKKLIRLWAAFLFNVGCAAFCECQVLWEVCPKSQTEWHGDFGHPFSTCCAAQINIYGHMRS